MNQSSVISDNASTSKYVVVEGPIGVGKSSLAKKLAATFDSDLVLEKPTDNPFLERFYKSPKRFALPTQLFFLFQRVRQMTQMKQDDMFNPGRISDYMMQKDALFAQVTLGDDEHRLYQQVYKNLTIDVPVPDLVIYLQAPVDVLIQRIQKRRVKYEQGIDSEYLQRLSDAYMTFFHRYSESPLLIVNATDIDFVNNEMHYQTMVEHIGRIDAGKHFFNPLV